VHFQKIESEVEKAGQVMGHLSIDLSGEASDIHGEDEPIWSSVIYLLKNHEC
jgi:hypothetical protein